MHFVRLTQATLAVALAVGSAGSAPAAEQTPAAQRVPSVQSIIRVSGLLGREITDASGNALGEVEDVVLLDGGRAFAVVAIGGLLGIAEREVLVPHGAITVSPSVPELLVYDGDASALRHAPRLDRTLDALDIAARERALLLRAREEHEDVHDAERELARARERLGQERGELQAVRDAMRELPRD